MLQLKRHLFSRKGISSTGTLAAAIGRQETWLRGQSQAKLDCNSCDQAYHTWSNSRWPMQTADGTQQLLLLKGSLEEKQLAVEAM